MNAPAALLALAAAGLAALVVFELLPGPGIPDPAIPLSQLPATAPAPQPTLDSNPAALVDTLLARPLFSQTRRPPNGAAPAASAPSAATPLPRMTAILIDGPRRSAIFASQNGRPTMVAEGGRIGPFTVQTIEPQQVIVIGPGGKRTVRTSFDPTLQPPAAPQLPQSLSLGTPQFPGIVPGFPLPQSAGAAR